MSVWIYEDSHLQSTEYVNEVSKVLHNMNVTWQCITSVYHPQSNGFLNNRILMEVLDGNICDWPNVIKGVFFARRVSKYTSTKFSPFFFMHNWEPSCILVDIEGSESEYPIYKETFNFELTPAISMRANIYHMAGENICSAQEKQCRD